MGFQKGNTVNLGRKQSLEERTMRSLAHKGLRPSDWGAGFKKGNKPWNKSENIARNAYFAGLFDGEGSVFVTYNGIKREGQSNLKKVQVAFAMRLDKAQPLYEGEKIWGGSLHERRPRKSNINWVLDWRLNQIGGEQFLKDIQPYLQIKNKQVEVALRFRYLQTRKRSIRKITEEELKMRYELEEELKNLNK